MTQVHDKKSYQYARNNSITKLLKNCQQKFVWDNYNLNFNTLNIAQYTYQSTKIAHHLWQGWQKLYFASLARNLNTIDTKITLFANWCNILLCCLVLLWVQNPTKTGVQLLFTGGSSYKKKNIEKHKSLKRTASMHWKYIWWWWTRNINNKSMGKA